MALSPSAGGVAVPEPALDLGLALVLGLLVGVQRQLQHHLLAGVRTFALITLFGALCALLVPLAGGWILGAGLLGVAIALVIGNALAFKAGSTHPGITTEVSALVMFAVGALVASGQREVGAAVGVSVAVLLQAKEFLHSLTERLGEKDVRAIITFALLTFVILPLAPDEPLGPFGTLNPHRIWLMVVLVVGISLGGYLVYKFAPRRAGVLAGGVFGGLISSTATTALYARRTRHAEQAASAAAAVLLIATCVMYVRVVVLVFVVAPAQAASLAGPMLAMFVATALAAGVVMTRSHADALAIPEQDNPTELRFALLFAAVYALVLVLVALGKRYLGDSGLYLVAAVSGLSDMDAITLSTAQLTASGGVDAETAWRAILIAAASNMVAKGGIVIALANARLQRIILICFAALIAVATAVWFGWPALRGG